MTAWLLFGGTLISAIFIGYQMVESHTEETTLLNMQLLDAVDRIDRLEGAVIQKNDYIKELQLRTIEAADADGVSDMFNDFFMHQDGDGEKAMPDD